VTGKRPRRVPHAMMWRLRTPARAPIALRMTPMIDLIFLLLTFFALTARFRNPEQFLPIQLPAAMGETDRIDVIEPMPVSFSTEGGACRIRIGDGPGSRQVLLSPESEPQELAAFAADVAAVLKGQNRTTADPVEIRCADDVAWDHLVKAYDVLYRSGIADITFRLDP